MLLIDIVEAIVNFIAGFIEGFGSLLQGFFQMDLFSRIMILMMLGMIFLVIIIIFQKKYHDKQKKKGMNLRKFKNKMSY